MAKRVTPTPNSWLEDSVETNESGELKADDLWNAYLHKCLVGKEEPVSRKAFGNSIHKLFHVKPFTKTVTVRKNTKVYDYVYKGISWKVTPPTDHESIELTDIPALAESWILWEPVTQDPDTIKLGLQSDLVCNGNRIFLNVTFSSTKWQLLVREEEIDLEALGVSSSFQKTSKCLNTVLSLVKKLNVCQGVVFKGQEVPKRLVKEKYRKVYESKSEWRVRSLKCCNIAAIASKTNTCRTCQFSANKRRRSTHDQMDVESLDSIELVDEEDSDIKLILENVYEMQVILKSQYEAVMAKLDLQVQELDLEVPEHNLQVQELNLEVPEHKPQVQELDLEVPEHNLQVQKLDLEVPEHRPQVQELDLEVPEHDLQQVQELDLQVKEDDLHDQDPVLEEMDSSDMDRLLRSVLPEVEGIGRLRTELETVSNGRDKTEISVDHSSMKNWTTMELTEKDRGVLKEHLLTRQSHPVVFRNMTSHWPARKWTLETLAAGILDGKQLRFRIGQKSKEAMQLETQCSYVEATLSDLVTWTEGKCSGDNPLAVYDPDSHWCYLDYKYMIHLFEDQPDILQAVDWGSFGFSGRDGKESTFWLGTTGAYTVCHRDTYGCNLMAQIYGRKRWVLFPPEETDHLYPTRVPYEESSIFSQVNIRQPDLTTHHSFKGATPHVVVLEPGDVLFVPRHWWHFVESLDTTISVNSWIDLEVDNEERMKESVVRTLMQSVLGNSEGPGGVHHWLNPTEDRSFLTTKST